MFQKENLEAKPTDLSILPDPITTLEHAAAQLNTPAKSKLPNATIDDLAGDRSSLNQSSVMKHLGGGAEEESLLQDVAKSIPQPVQEFEKKLVNLINRGETTEAIQSLHEFIQINDCLLYTSPSPRDATLSRMPSSA